MNNYDFPIRLLIGKQRVSVPIRLDEVDIERVLFCIRSVTNNAIIPIANLNFYDTLQAITTFITTQIQNLDEEDLIKQILAVFCSKNVLSIIHTIPKINNKLSDSIVLIDAPNVDFMGNCQECNRVGTFCKNCKILYIQDFFDIAENTIHNTGSCFTINIVYLVLILLYIFLHHTSHAIKDGVINEIDIMSNWFSSIIIHSLDKKSLQYWKFDTGTKFNKMIQNMRSHLTGITEGGLKIILLNSDKNNAFRNCLKTLLPKLKIADINFITVTILATIMCEAYSSTKSYKMLARLKIDNKTIEIHNMINFLLRSDKNVTDERVNAIFESLLSLKEKLQHLKSTVGHVDKMAMMNVLQNHTILIEELKRFAGPSLNLLETNGF